jgi:hypothetical protein
MSLTSAYLITTKNLDAFLNAIRGAKAPENFTNKFLKQLDFSSSNDRLFIGVLKALGMIDETGVPTKRYFEFLDQGESGRVLAEAIREAYEDLFAVNKKAQDLTVEEVKNKLKTLTQGQKSDNVVGLMANTFKALTALADWTTPVGTPVIPAPLKLEGKVPAVRESLESKVVHKEPRDPAVMSLHHDIHIHLPESRDPAVFDAIFDAMKRHLGV